MEMHYVFDLVRAILYFLAYIFMHHLTKLGYKENGCNKPIRGSKIIKLFPFCGLGKDVH